jgi:vancomycin resistance protein VanJ
MKAPPPSRIRNRLAWLACALLVGLTALLWVGGDLWWPVFPFLFGPRLVVGVLLLPTLPLLLTQPRRGVVPFVIATVVFVVGILGFRVGPGRIIPGPRADLRIISYNVDNKPAVVARLLSQVDSLGIDVVVLVECPGLQGTERAIPANWVTAGRGEICLYSRYPILEWNTPAAPGPRSGARAVLSVGGTVVQLGLVHLVSPHAALLTFKDKSEIPELGPLTRENRREREQDSERAAQFFADDGKTPTIVAGDFNLPIESRIFQRYWSGYSDSFEHAGLGLGTTFRYRVYMIRIDHILTRGGITAVRSWVGPDLGSDHLPVIADLSLPKR